MGTVNVSETEEAMSGLVDAQFCPPGTPSNEAPGILGTGRGDITTIFTSLSARHPEGEDADYLRWHTLDHRPEQYRLEGIRSSLRLVSTPDCRAVRAAGDPSLDATDHVMTYFFTDTAPLEGFNDLAVALREAGRMTYLLPSVQRGVYTVQERIAAPRIKLGADVLPWWPANGVYLLIETATAAVDDLAEVAGVAGLWSAKACSSQFSGAAREQRITYLFLDGDVVETGQRLRPILLRRWEKLSVRPLLAAPFYSLIPHQWSRYLP
jgi:hypothetical protein